MLVPYPEIRDRFLARLPDDPAVRLESYVAIGRFVVDRWMAEELDRVEGQPLDEAACWDRWDQCSEKHLRDLRAEAVQILDFELRKGRVGAFLKDWAKRTEPLKTAIAICKWLWWEAMKGFVHAIGILVFGLIVVWAQPHIAKAIRSTIDDTLPRDTRPTNESDALSNASGANEVAP